MVDCLRKGAGGTSMYGARVSRYGDFSPGEVDWSWLRERWGVYLLQIDERHVLCRMNTRGETRMLAY